MIRDVLIRATDEWDERGFRKAKRQKRSHSSVFIRGQFLDLPRSSVKLRDVLIKATDEWDEPLMAGSLAGHPER